MRSWRAYTRALINRGRRTVWFDEEAITAWRHTELAPGPGAPRCYADLAAVPQCGAAPTCVP